MIDLILAERKRKESARLFLIVSEGQPLKPAAIERVLTRSSFKSYPSL